jgi:hypothetical protein
LTRFLDMHNLRGRETEQGEPMPRGLDQLRVRGVARNQQLLLRRQQIRSVDPREPLPATDRIADRAHVELFDPARLTDLNRFDPVLIHRHHADGIDVAREAALLHSAEAHAQVLHDARIDGDAAARCNGGACLVRVLRNQLHVHEG